MRPSGEGAGRPLYTHDCPPRRISTRFDRIDTDPSNSRQVSTRLAESLGNDMRESDRPMGSCSVGRSLAGPCRLGQHGCSRAGILLPGSRRLLAAVGGPFELGAPWPSSDVACSCFARDRYGHGMPKTDSRAMSRSASLDMRCVVSFAKARFRRICHVVGSGA